MGWLGRDFGNSSVDDVALKGHHGTSLELGSIFGEKKYVASHLKSKFLLGLMFENLFLVSVSDFLPTFPAMPNKA